MSGEWGSINWVAPNHWACRECGQWDVWGGPNAVENAMSSADRHMRNHRDELEAALRNGAAPS